MAAMFDWNEMKAFLAVARSGSTAAAARLMGVNQTTVARWLDSLERDLGCRLVDRGQGGARLTELGQALVAEAEAMERAAGAVERTVESQRREVSGVVRVTCSEALANIGIVPFLGEFNALYPDLRLELELGERMVDLEAGEADVAIRSAVAMPDSNLIARKLATVDWALYCSRDYIARQGDPRGPEGLKGHTLMVGDGEAEKLPGMPMTLALAPEAAAVLTFSSLTSLISGLHAGLGVGPMPCPMADFEPALVQVRPPWPQARATTWLVTRAELKDVPRVRAFIDFITPRILGFFRQTEDRIAAAQAHDPA